jgi:UPF0755 protein
MLLKVIKTALTASVLILFVFSAWIVHELYRPFVPPDLGILLIEKGKGVEAIARDLLKEKILRSQRPFVWSYQLFFSQETLKAGEYEFIPPLRLKRILLDLAQGKIYLHLLTVPEGLTGKEVSALLKTQDFLAGNSFHDAFLNRALVSSWDFEAQDLEGYLFPETYHFPRDTAAGTIVEAMVGEFKKTFGDGWKSRARELGMTVRKVVILASLIEKETAVPEERKLVSAVFHNRLRIGMKLDCDPTIIYALKRDGTYRGRLLKKDLGYPSLYNTYLHAGLPPGPICNPGRGSLEAALFPSADNYLYFVSRNDGSHHFSATFLEHQRAVEKYRSEKN